MTSLKQRHEFAHVRQKRGDFENHIGSGTVLANLPIDLIAHVKANMEHHAITTINIGIYQDGTLEQSSLDMMRQLRRAIREK